MIDYEVLRVIWWLLVGVLLIGFAITDGFDLGVGALLTLVGRTDEERRVMINTIGPHWDGNQVWFITAGGAIFAAFPMIYATAFSGFYLALFLTLAALWMRPLGFDYRSKLTNPTWRRAWDWALFAGGIVPALIFGVALGNVLQGVPFTFDEILKVTYHGSFWALLNPFALLAGLVSVAMLLMHGSVWLQLKTADRLFERARGLSVLLGLATAALFVLAGIWVSVGIDGYVLVGAVDGLAASNPMNKAAVLESGAWLNNYGRFPLLIVAPLLGIGGALAVAWLSLGCRSGWAFVASSLSLAGIIFTAGGSMFPFMLPSSANPSMSLTVWDASSSETTLMIMLVVALIFVPLVLAYTAWSFWAMRGRILEQDVTDAKAHTPY
ncbi:cytochrome d ubiquinol oxidase subunit II [Microbulbifer rhizosphaerae]|uniref:Cytochrome d ubiquinol oxidase subunit II n=1 Tax=Microbulbifer rhizosphaerae TaxID=1562603 RepID=A0A7W4WCY6_9GAMM|nr:cytochrome d ubiquinol oxidase subunit II [Microbulbifer rhizosphaerae]MBB3061281.1 cytochrome d ubiquinol oxidase subunit II [Microbulbifer rhizosphaerae]